MLPWNCLRHNTRDRIKEISAEYVMLESGVRLTYELASKHLRPPYACAYHSAQGLEFKGLLHLTDLQLARICSWACLAPLTQASCSWVETHLRYTGLDPFGSVGSVESVDSFEGSKRGIRF